MDIILKDHQLCSYNIKLISFRLTKKKVKQMAKRKQYNNNKNTSISKRTRYEEEIEEENVEREKEEERVKENENESNMKIQPKLDFQRTNNNSAAEGSSVMAQSHTATQTNSWITSNITQTIEMHIIAWKLGIKISLNYGSIQRYCDSNYLY